MMVGDLIVEIDGKSIFGYGYYNSIELLLGNSDKATELVCRRGKDEYKISLKKGIKPQIDKIVENKLFDNGIFYYNLLEFEYGTTFQLKNELEKYEGIKGLIIDLRSNGGGVTEEAVSLFDLFAGSGNKVKTVEEKSKKEEIFETTDNITYQFPVAILVSEQSKSSSEILAALFKDTGRGKVIGTQTGGKGVFQKWKELDDRSSYTLVAGYYYVNDIPNYNNIGITPDIIIEMESDLRNTENDIQLQKAFECLS